MLHVGTRHLPLALALTLSALSCRPAEVRCPDGFRPLPDRAGAISSLLRSTPEGAALLDSGAAPRFCFAGRDSSVIDSTGTLFLDERRGDRELAARVGHLLQHRQAPVFARLDAGASRDPADCAALASLAYAEETRSRALESRLLRQLGVPAAIAEPEVTIASYRARCVSARARPSPHTSPLASAPIPRGDAP